MGSADDGSFLLAYLPFGHPVAIDVGKLSADRVRACWYDPREGEWLPIGHFAGAAGR